MINEKKLLEIRSSTASFLKERRIELGLTQKELADKCGMKQTSIDRIEAAKFYLTTKQLWIFCDVLKLEFIFEKTNG